MQIRRGTAADLPAVAGILAECPEAANWLPDRADFLFATVDGEPAGFIVWRHTAPDEIEILNLGVARQFRRRGVAKASAKAMYPRKPCMRELDSATWESGRHTTRTRLRGPLS
jgi:ribosomal protein S18 acetylase RimI-like enzyme